MKKFAATLLALVMVLSLVACGGSGNDNSSATSGGDTASTDSTAATDTTDANTPDTTTPDTATPDDTGDASFTTLEAGKLHMSTEPTFPPYEMATDDGGFEGIDVEIAEAIAGKLGLELVIDSMGFDAALTAVQAGQTDIAMAGITITEDRKEVMDFSDSYATAVQVIIVQEGSPIAAVDDLANAELIGTQKATTGNIFCTDDYGEDHVIAYDNGALAVMALANGQVDAVVIDNEPAKSFVAENEGLVILDTEYAVEDYAIGFAKGNDALKDAVNTALVELMNDGTVQRIVDKYITAG